jgi:hypothetical protein
MAKEPYVKPAVKSEILKAEVLCSQVSGSVSRCGGPTFFWGFPK